MEVMLPMLTNALLMVADVLQMVANESRVANQLNVGKIDENSEKYIKMSWQHCI
jgi:hypothetical protein